MYVKPPTFKSRHVEKGYYYDTKRICGTYRRQNKERTGKLAEPQRYKNFSYQTAAPGKIPIYN